jgi:hypothetical protein
MPKDDAMEIHDDDCGRLIQRLNNYSVMKQYEIFVAPASHVFYGEERSI